MPACRARCCCIHRYDVVGGLSKQIQEIKEVIELPIKHPELFEALGVAQPKVGAAVGCAGHLWRALHVCRLA